ncbi:MAG TPA: SDR family oxidoreductase [Hyphomicrobiaceae bacterium]|nr:SDR family oxidoreductase [Hyphomicrobiaceae bacterium]
MTKRVALIAGATGAASRRLVDVLLADPNWTVLGISRRAPAERRERFVHVAADLLDGASLASKGTEIGAVTHTFYTSRGPFKEGGVEDVPGNVAMLRHLVDALEAHAPNLEHIHLVEGTKWYGMHLGPTVSPHREDAPRHLPPNFYYDQQDLLAAHQAGKRWTWSASRPEFIYDYAPERARNVVSLIGVWAAICRELGTDLDFPGKPGCFSALTEMTDATLLARAMVHLSTSPKAANQAFNVTDGDHFRWQHFWPRIAAHFGMRPGIVRPMPLATWMADKGPVWQRIAEKHGLKASPIADPSIWSFGDFLWRQDGDLLSSIVKIRQTGFGEAIDTEANILAQLTRYREARLLP